MAYVDVSVKANESAADCYTRRRSMLTEGWSFACLCDRCGEESEALTVDDVMPLPEVDGAQCEPLPDNPFQQISGQDK